LVNGRRNRADPVEEAYKMAKVIRIAPKPLQTIVSSFQDDARHQTC
jgi:hypothetical protein